MRGILHYFSRLQTIVYRLKNEMRDSSYNKNCRKRLTNNNFTIICNNCLGGLLYHRYHMRFLSPTINLFFEPTDFVCFCEHIKEYLEESKLIFINSEKNYPVGLLQHENLPDVKLFFMHYLSDKEAYEKWTERGKRVNYDNLYIIGSDKGIGKDEILRIDSIPTKGTVVFTSKQYDDIECSFFLKKYHDQADVGKFVNDVDLKTGARYVEKAFDFVDFFNKKKE